MIIYSTFAISSWLDFHVRDAWSVLWDGSRIYFNIIISLILAWYPASAVADDIDCLHWVSRHAYRHLNEHTLFFFDAFILLSAINAYRLVLPHVTLLSRHAAIRSAKIFRQKLSPLVLSFSATASNSFSIVPWTISWRKSYCNASISLRLKRYIRLCRAAFISSLIFSHSIVTSSKWSKRHRRTMRKSSMPEFSRFLLIMPILAAFGQYVFRQCATLFDGFWYFTGISAMPIVYYD